MSDRKEYLKKYRLEHKEKYREYQRKYRGTHLSTYEKLQQENQKYKEVIDKAIEYINDNLIISSILDGKKYYTINNYSFDYGELLEILKEVE